MDKFLNHVLSLPNNISHKRKLKLIKKECQREYEFWKTTLFSGPYFNRDERFAYDIAIVNAERFIIAKNTYHLGIFMRDFYRLDFLFGQHGFKISTLMKLGRVAQRDNKHISFVYGSTANYGYPECDYNWYIIRQHNIPDMRKLKFTDTTDQYNETVKDFASSIHKLGIDFDIAPYIFSPAK